ncbi:dyslexia-associated protein KIAA0319-like protein [Acanthaster planci]|uniref:Dyslexia-associated protein KIAA0319-like protein n=1 Tax=Acanthaster planci TaxID=133434 RepID=A0A8B7ZKW6_ACAPL|nr:dyslexia-associated protein KIAA0319-like protein [Acanthaster planci]
MGPVETTQDPGLCPCCTQSRTKLSQNPYHERNSVMLTLSLISSSLDQAPWQLRSIKVALNIHSQLFLPFTLLMMLLLQTGLADATCSTGEPFVGYFPSVSEKQLKLQHGTLASDCAETCCLEEVCDLAWIMDEDCFHGQCYTESDCIPLASMSASSIVYVMERPTQPRTPVSGVVCSPHDKWDTCPIGEHCDKRLGECQCNDGRTRSYKTNRCEYEQRVEPWNSLTGSDSLKKPEYAKTYDSHNPYADKSEGFLDDVSKSGTSEEDDKFRFCKSEEECEEYEYCFGLQHFGAGICKCLDGFHESKELGMCIRETPEGEVRESPKPVTMPSKPSSIADSENPLTTPPATPPVTLPETPLATPPEDGDTPKETHVPTLVLLPTPQVRNDTDKQGGSDGGGANGAGVGGSELGDREERPHKKSEGKGLTHQGDTAETQNGTESNPSDGDNIAPTPLSDTPTERAGTQSNTGLDQLTDRTLLPESKTQSPSTHTPTVVKLTVSAGKDKTLQLPDQDTVTLHAYVIPTEPPQGQEYTYDWQVVDEPDSGAGKMIKEGKNLKLEELSAGVYQFKVEVHGKGSYGSATINVTVLAPPRVNQPPKAIINPVSQEIILPNPGTYLDGSHSTDDDKIVTYHWQEIEGPVKETKIIGDDQLLQLTDLVPGHYVIRLTVTDSDGVTDSALANVTVKEEIDNPPIAKAGKDVIIKLPVNSAVLYGNSSFDDHPGLVYEWSKISGPVADMSGSSSPILHLNSLEEGTYIFRLTVTDSKHRKDSDEATVIVKPENNLPPRADAGPDKELSLPDDSTTLDGIGSTDDLGITSYFWEKVSGPNDPKIEDADHAMAKVSGLIAGRYVFKLTVGDRQGATNSDTVDVVVKKEVNKPPVARAGPNITIHLPNSGVELNGSRSKDDKGIVSYEWKRDAKSPAAGTRYSHRLNLVVLTFDVEVSKFTYQNRIDMARSLAVLLSVRDEDVVIQQVYQTPNEQLQVMFYANNATTSTAMPGPRVVKILSKKKLSGEMDLLKFKVLELDTMICQKNCSGHGKCDPFTKMCICESFWMENYVRRWMGDRESNCDWSILYVIIAACGEAIALVGLCWLCIYCIKRSRRKVKRRRRYNLLSQDLDGMESMEMLPKNANEPQSEMTNNGNGSVLDKLTDKGSFQGKQSSSIMISESDDDTDEETTLFDSKKRQGKNGKANGSVMAVQPRKKRPFPLISSRSEKL